MVDNQRVNVVNRLGMSARDPKNRPPIGVTPEEGPYDEIEKICREMERPRAWVAYKLLLRGLAAYNRDGHLNEPSARPKTITAPNVGIGRKKSGKKGKTGTNDD